MKIRYYSFFYLLFFLCWFNFNAQKSGQYLYSLFGVGEPVSLRFHHHNLSGGAVAAIIPDTLFPSLMNPEQGASLADIRFATFEVGGAHHLHRFYKSGTSSSSYSLSRFDYAALGLPLGKKGGLCLGIAPLSTMGYSLESYYYDPGVGNITIKQNGEGGLNQAYVGTGFQPFKNTQLRYLRKCSGDSARVFDRKKYFFYKWLGQLRAGVRAAWVFGQLIQYTDIRYPNNLVYYHHFRENIIRPMGIMPSFCLLSGWSQDSVSHRSLKEKNYYGFGVVWYPSVNISSVREVYSYNYYSTAYSIQRKDSSEKNERRGESFRLPQRWMAGISFRKGYKWTVGMDAEYVQWSKSMDSGREQQLVDSRNVALGVSWTPDKFAFGKNTYFQRVRYSAGISYFTGYIKINHHPLRQWMASGGVSLPIGIRTGTGLLHLGIQYYRITSDPEIFFTQKGIRLLFGITFNSTYFEDLWFRKFRYD